MFRREFSILTASGGEKALELINTKPVALVLSDHRMPGMTGSELLARVNQLDPKTVRFLVTAYGDAETLSSAINDGSIYRFIPKPWTPEDMRINLRRGIEVYALDREREQLVRELSLLNRVSHSITQELALEPLLDLLLTTVIEDLGYDAAGILFLDGREEVLSWGRFAPADSPVNASPARAAAHAQQRPGLPQAAARGRGADPRLRSSARARSAAYASGCRRSRPTRSWWFRWSGRREPSRRSRSTTGAAARASAATTRRCSRASATRR